MDFAILVIFCSFHGATGFQRAQGKGQQRENAQEARAGASV